MIEIKLKAFNLRSSEKIDIFKLIQNITQFLVSVDRIQLFNVQLLVIYYFIHNNKIISK